MVESDVKQHTHTHTHTHLVVRVYFPHSEGRSSITFPFQDVGRTRWFTRARIEMVVFQLLFICRSRDTYTSQSDDTVWMCYDKNKCTLDKVLVHCAFLS